MRTSLKFVQRPKGASSPLESQPCVRAVRNANLDPKLKKEIDLFIIRNILPDCGRVPPNCLKAHIIRTAKSLGFPGKKIVELEGLFKSDVGYRGYYLDAGKLKKV